MSWQIDEYIGETRPWPRYITVFRGHTDERKVYVPSGSDARAERVVVSNRETDHATGHCECGRCGLPIDPWDAFCRHCGAELGDA